MTKLNGSQRFTPSELEYLANKGRELGYVLIGSSENPIFLTPRGKKIKLRKSIKHFLANEQKIEGFVFKKGTEVKIRKDHAYLSTNSGLNVGFLLSNLQKFLKDEPVVIAGNKFSILL